MTPWLRHSVTSLLNMPIGTAPVGALMASRSFHRVKTAA